MKPMKDRKMGMGSGEADSFFPNSPNSRKLPLAGEIKGFKYPDTDQAIHSCQNDSVSKVNKSLPKPEFRH